MALKFTPPTSITPAPDKVQALNDPLGQTFKTLPALWAAYKLQREKTVADEKKTKFDTASDMVKRQLELLGLSQNRVVVDPTTGTKTEYPGVTGYRIELDADGIPALLKEDGASAGTGEVKTPNPPQPALAISTDDKGNITETKNLGNVKPVVLRPTSEGAASADKGDARQRVTDNLSTLKGLYEQLSEGGGIVDTKESGFSNLVRRAKSSRAGQAVGGAVGTDNQSVRNQIKQIQPLLIQDIRQAAKMGARGLDSEKELQFYLQAATDPSRDLQSNLEALKVLENAYGLGAGDGKTSGPRAGDVEEGYRFKGGDPADSANWEKF